MVYTVRNNLMNEMTILPLFSKHVAISGDTYNMSEEELDFIKNLKRIENIDYNSVTENQYILELPTFHIAPLQFHIRQRNRLSFSRLLFLWIIFSIPL